MAYLKPLNVRCDAGCGSWATAELLTNRNGHHGNYCNRCGMRLEKVIQAEEDAPQPVAQKEQE